MSVGMPRAAGVEVIVMGHNKGQKHGISLLDSTNQNFVSIPIQNSLLPWYLLPQNVALLTQRKLHFPGQPAGHGWDPCLFQREYRRIRFPAGGVNAGCTVPETGSWSMRISTGREYHPQGVPGCLAGLNDLLPVHSQLCLLDIRICIRKQRL